MIITVEGKIGSGKTYWAVNFLLEKFYVWKDELFQYVPKGNLRVISNIRDLALPHIDLDEEINKMGSIEKIFNENYPGLKDANTQTIFVIDEAQAPNLFHRKYYNPSVFLFFQKSRHLGIDIVLITQDKWTLCKEIQVLSEYNVVALPRSVRTKNVFMYKYMHGNEVGRRKSIIFNKRVASCYRSFEKLENEKITYLWKKYAAAVVIAFIVVIVGFKVAMGTFFNQGDKKPTRVVSGQAGGSVRPPASTSPPANSSSSVASASGYGVFSGSEKLSASSSSSPDVNSKIMDSKVNQQKDENMKVPEGGPSTGVRIPGRGGKGEGEHEPLIPMKCQRPDGQGWQECFEGGKYVGRFKAWIPSTAPVLAYEKEVD